MWVPQTSAVGPFILPFIIATTIIILWAVLLPAATAAPDTGSVRRHKGAPGRRLKLCLSV